MPNSNWPYADSKLFVGGTLDPDVFTKGYTMAHFAPEDLGLRQRWESETGVFVFLQAESADLELPRLEASLREYLSDPLHQNVRFLWVENPSDQLIEWRSNSLSTELRNGEHFVSQLTYIDLANYAFSIAEGTRIELDETNDPVGFLLTRDPSNANGFELSSGKGCERFYELGAEARIPMTGDQAGCLEFEFQVEKKGTPNGSYGYPALSSLEAGFRVFFRDPDFPETGNNFYLASHRFPLVQEDSDHELGFAYFPDTLEFKVSFDPLYPLIADRTHFELLPLDGQFAQTGIPSGYRTNLGYNVHLLPIEGESRFQFAMRPAQMGTEDEEPLPMYLVPSGNFDMKVPRYKEDGSVDLVPTFNVVCGISGVEYIKIESGSISQISFVPDQPAFARAYVSVSSMLRDLTTLLESYSGRSLPPDTRDLDMRIEENEGGETEPALGITDVERRTILEIVRRDYFPPGYVFSASQLEEYDNLEIVEDLVNWLQASLQAVSLEVGNDGGALNSSAETSWAYVHGANGVVYFAQPDQAVLYKAESSSQQFLDFMEIPSVGLPQSLSPAEETDLEATTGLAALAFPMLPYGNVDRKVLTDIRQLEISLLNNFRRDRIQKISEATGHVTSLKTAPSPQQSGTTPQGLIATFSEDCRTIEQLQMAKDTKDQAISLVNIEHGSSLKASLQANQLFMVVTDPEALAANFSTDVLDAFPGLTNSMDIQDWIFELGTENWEIKDTILLFKFHNKPLLDLAGNTDSWSLADDFNGNKEASSRTLVRLLKKAVEIGNSADPKARRKYEVLARAATEPNWTGVLALNVHVPLRNLPDALKALAGGMDPDLFFSQYVGIEVTQVSSTGTNLETQQSSLFGLIDYSNPLVPKADPSGYNFHVPSLTVVFQNAQITDFAAEVLVIMDKLFEEKTSLYQSPDGRNILRLQGVAEEHNGKITYSFGFSGANHFLLSGKVVEEVEIYKAQFATDPIPNPDADPLDIKGRFFFWGRMRFAYQKEFDILSFGSAPGTGIAPVPQAGEDPPPPDYLNLSNLQLVMSLTLEQANNLVRDKAFSFDPQQMAFDLERSGWREQSLYEKFPLKFSSFRSVVGDPNAFGRSGYMPVDTPLLAADLGDTWYGITYELNLGSLGALAGSAGLVVSIMAAWSPEKEGVFIGLKLPGSSGGKKEISIQGLLKVSFKKIQFVVYPIDPEEDLLNLPLDTEREVGYLLKIKNIVLKFFVVSFPPSGQTEMILFGDPRDGIDREDKLLGWYAAYAR